MGLLTHERFGKFKCGKCAKPTREMMGCPFPIPDDERAAELGGAFTPVPVAERNARWPRWVIPFPRGSEPWDSKGCPWPQVLGRPELDEWMAAYHLLREWHKTPVDLGYWPELRSDYLSTMFLIEGLMVEAEKETVDRERERARHGLTS